MELSLFVVDAFATEIFKGNPGAVCPLEKWLDEKIMQKIAMENNLSETAFFVKEGDEYHIRWFTPTVEIPLCGHATLASSFVIFNYLEKEINEIVFNSMSGKLKITKDGDIISLNFPANKPNNVDISEDIILALKKSPKELYFNKSFVALFDSEQEIRDISPDFTQFEKLHSHGVIVTAEGEKSDFVSRFFIPSAGINEDPVTGYAHTLLTPFWSEKLNKKKLHAFQISERSGELFLEDLNDRVKISGKAILYSKGTIFLDL